MTANESIGWLLWVGYGRRQRAAAGQFGTFDVGGQLVNNRTAPLR
jgi:hypothetical protein